MSTVYDAVKVKGKLLKYIKELPESDAFQVLDFIEFLEVKRHKRKNAPKSNKLAVQKDPILKMLGMANVAPFSDKIDQELYG
jgi:hypothetical protein